MSDLAKQIRRSNHIRYALRDIGDAWPQHLSVRKFVNRLEFMFSYTDHIGNTLSLTSTTVLMDFADLGDALFPQPRKDMI